MKIKPIAINTDIAPIPGYILSSLSVDVFTFIPKPTNVYTITQVAHPFTFRGQAYYYNNAGYGIASSADLLTVSTGIIVDIIDANTFKISDVGRTAITDASFAASVVAGSYYFVKDDGTGGLIDNDTNMLVSNPLIQVISIVGTTVTIDLLSYRMNDRTANAGFPGSTDGYLSGGSITPYVASDMIDRFSFLTDASALPVMTLTSITRDPTGHSSLTDGFTAGGVRPLSINTIDKFSFSTTISSVGVGDLYWTIYYAAGQSSFSYGYIGGGPGQNQNVITKFSYATVAPQIQVGYYDTNIYAASGQSSKTAAYTSGRNNNPTDEYIRKVTFAVDSNSTHVGNLTNRRSASSGQSSTDYGYVMGGYGASFTKTIEKFLFSTDSNANVVGNLLEVIYEATGVSSISYGYTCGGETAGVSISKISKITYSNDIVSNNISNLYLARYRPGGHQI